MFAVELEDCPKGVAFGQNSYASIIPQSDQNDRVQDVSYSETRIVPVGGIPLPNGWRQMRSFLLIVKHTDGEVLISEPKFNMYADGPTDEEAIEAFGHVLADYHEMLAEMETTLAPNMLKQLAYLRQLLQHE